jgi:hypothetical protein
VQLADGLLDKTNATRLEGGSLAEKVIDRMQVTATVLQPAFLIRIYLREYYGR